MPTPLPAPDSVETKVILALVSVVAGWLIKAGWDAFMLHRRMRRLGPVVVAQIRSVAHLATGAGAAPRLPLVAQRLADAQKSVTELILNGSAGDQWVEGLERLLRVLDAIQNFETEAPANKGMAMSKINGLAVDLEAWCKATMPPPGQ